MDFFTNIENVYVSTLQILSIGLIIGALEDIFSWSEFKNRNILSWRVFKVSYGSFQKKRAFKLIHYLFDDSLFIYTFFLRLVTAIGMLFISLSHPFLLFILLITHLILLSLVGIRNAYGLDGTFHLYLILLTGISIGILNGIDSSTSLFCLIFIVSQLILAYFISGITKLISPIWRSGKAIRGIFSTTCYGHPLIYQLTHQKKKLSILISLTVIFFEIFFFTVFLDIKICYLFICGGVLFHLSNAYFMGLNNFFFAFMAAYPSLIYLVSKLKIG